MHFKIPPHRLIIINAYTICRPIVSHSPHSFAVLEYYVFVFVFLWPKPLCHRAMRGFIFFPCIRSGTPHCLLLIIHHNHVTWPRPFQSITSCNMSRRSTSLLQFSDNGSTCPDTCNCCLSKSSLIWIAPSKALYIGWGEGKACTAWVYSTGGTLLKPGSNTTCAKSAYAMWKVYDAQHYD